MIFELTFKQHHVYYIPFPYLNSPIINGFQHLAHNLHTHSGSNSNKHPVRMVDSDISDLLEHQRVNLR